MKTAFAAAGVLAIAGTSLASYQAQAFQIQATGAFSSGALFGGGLSIVSQANPGGVLWAAGGLLDGANAEVQNSTLLGFNPGGNAPATGAPQWSVDGGSTLAGIVPDPWAGNGDTSFNLAVAGLPPVFVDPAFNPVTGGNEIWVGQFAVEAGTAAPTLDLLLIGDGAGISQDLTSGSGTLDGVPVFAQLRLRGSGQNFNGAVDVYDLVLTDVPAPGAAALLGLAGVAGVRRRRA